MIIVWADQWHKPKESPQQHEAPLRKSLRCPRPPLEPCLLWNLLPNLLQNLLMDLPRYLLPNPLWMQLPRRSPTSALQLPSEKQLAFVLPLLRYKYKTNLLTSKKSCPGPMSSFVLVFDRAGPPIVSFHRCCRLGLEKRRMQRKTFLPEFVLMFVLYSLCSFFGWYESSREIQGQQLIKPSHAVCFFVSLTDLDPRVMNSGEWHPYFDVAL